MLFHAPDTIRRSSYNSELLLVVFLSLAAITMLVSGRSTAILFPVFAALVVVNAWLRNDIRTVRPSLDGVTLSVALFVLFSLSSALWAASPSHALSRAALAAAAAIASFVATSALQGAPQDSIDRMARGLLVGFFIGAGFILIELLTKQSILIWVLNLKLRVLRLGSAVGYVLHGDRVVAVDALVYNRSVVVLLMFFWPVAMCIRAIVAAPRRAMVLTAACVLTAVVVLLSVHSTSKVALIAGVLCFGLTLWAPRFTYYAVSAGWIASCLVILPLAPLAYDAKLQDSPWLKESAQARIIIWRQTALQTRDAPILGRGADMTHELGPAIEKTLPKEKFEQQMSIHAHSVFLQTWFELGAVGALLLTGIGLCIFRHIRSMAPPLQPFAYATAVCSWVYMSAGFGMWQAWYLALFGLIPALTVIGWRAMRGSSRLGSYEAGRS